MLDNGVTATNPDQAYLVLKYRYNGVTEVIPSTNLYPVDPTLPSSGLTATYYDVDGFNSTLPGSQVNPHAFQRVDPNIDFDWAKGRPNYSTISGDDTYSARWTGHLILPCDGVYQFQTNGDVNDGGRLWIDDSRVMSRWSRGPLSGAMYLQQGTHDFKFDWYEETNAAVARLMWKTPCVGSPGWVTIPQGSFTPNASYGRSTGFVVDGGDNGNNTSYWVWQTSTSATNPTPLDVTGSNGNWGPRRHGDDGAVFCAGRQQAGVRGWRLGRRRGLAQGAQRLRLRSGRQCVQESALGHQHLATGRRHQMADVRERLPVRDLSDDLSRRRLLSQVDPTAVDAVRLHGADQLLRRSRQAVVLGHAGSQTDTRGADQPEPRRTSDGSK